MDKKSSSHDKLTGITAEGQLKIWKVGKRREKKKVKRRSALLVVFPEKGELLCRFFPSSALGIFACSFSSPLITPNRRERKKDLCSVSREYISLFLLRLLRMYAILAISSSVSGKFLFSRNA